MSSATILVVEDEPDVLTVAAWILEDAGYRVLEADGADEALKILANHQHVDLVFSDIQMSGCMNGIGLAHHLHTEQKELPVLLTSANGRTYYHNYPTETPFLDKPYDRRSLLAMISKSIHAG